MSDVVRLPEIDPISTGRQIRRMVKRKYGGDIPKFADDLCVSQWAVYKWIRGRNIPTADMLVRMAFLLDCGIDDLLVVENGKK